MTFPGQHRSATPAIEAPPVIVQAACRLDLNEIGASTLADEFSRVAGSSAAYLPRQIALVSVARGHVRSTLVIDGAWLELAVEANETDRSLVEGIDLPRDVVLAVLPLWPEDWHEVDETTLERRIHDGICYVAA